MSAPVKGRRVGPRAAFAAALVAAVVLAGTWACADLGTGPRSGTHTLLAFSIHAAEGVSSAESDALGRAFDRVDRFHVTVKDSVTGAVYADTVVSVRPGAAAHELAVNLPEEALGRRLDVRVVGLVGELALFVSSVVVEARQESSEVTAEVPARYVGPGLRGSVTDAAGRGVAGVTANLVQNGSSVGTTTSAADGSFLFAELTPGRYRVTVSPLEGQVACPAQRDVTLADAGTSLVVAFQVRAGSCSVRVLVVSGGDVDDTGAAAGALSGAADVTTETFFFVSRTPGIETLRGYDVVLVFQNGLFNQSVDLGNELAQFVALGGNVVFASFFWQGTSGSGFGSPGWGALEGMSPLSAMGGATYTSATLGTVVPHPLTDGLTSLSSNGYRGGVSASGTVVASWSDGVPLIAYGTGPAGQRFVGVSLFPGGGADGDVGRLWQNAVRWAGAAGGPARTGAVGGG